MSDGTVEQKLEVARHVADVLNSPTIRAKIANDLNLALRDLQNVSVGSGTLLTRTISGERTHRVFVDINVEVRDKTPVDQILELFEKETRAALAGRTALPSAEI